MAGIAIVLPIFWLIARIPGIEPGADIAQARANRLAAFFLDPGPKLLKAVLIMPLLEELFYRGLVLQLLRRYLPAGVAVAMTTTWFAVTHFGGGLANVLFAAAMGLLFAWLVMRTGSLYPSIACHAAANATGWLVLHPVSVSLGLRDMAAFAQGWPAVAVAGSAGLAAVAVGILRSETCRAGRALAA